MFAVDLEVRLEGVWRPFGEAVRESVQIAVREGAHEARTRHAYTDRTGRLTRSIQHYIATYDQWGAVGVIETKVRYASFVENGTQPHTIEPRRKQALRWEGQDGEHFARRVNHPGTRPHPFMGPGLLKAERVFEREFEVRAARAAAEI